jgi:hypothetical protein
MSAQPSSFEQQLRRALRYVAAGFHAVWLVLRVPLGFGLNLLLALILLFEEWGWRPLSNLLASLARFRLWALIERWIAGLPPYGALCALVVPSGIILPAKLLGLYFLATGHIAMATVVIVAAKVIGTGLVARIFMLTKPQLMQIAWFRTAYERFVPWQEALFARIRESWVWRYGRLVRHRADAFVRRSWALTRPRVEALWQDMRGWASAKRPRSVKRPADDRRNSPASASRNRSAIK